MAYYPSELAYIVEAYLMEQGLRAQELSSAALGRRVTLLSVIIQCNGLSLAHRAIVPFLNPVLFIDDNIYPENMRQLIICNAPSFFSILWTLVKPLIDKQTRAKFVILGAAEEGAGGGSEGGGKEVVQRIGLECTPRGAGRDVCQVWARGLCAEGGRLGRGVEAAG